MRCTGYHSASALIGAAQARSVRSSVSVRTLRAARAALVSRQLSRRRRIRLQGEQLGVPAGRAVRRGHPAFRRRLAARDRGCARPSPASRSTSCTRSSSRTAIRRRVRGVRRAQLSRSTARRSSKKIAEETGGCRDLTLWVRVARVAPRTARSRSSASTASPAPRPRACSSRRGRRPRSSASPSTSARRRRRPDAYVAALAEVRQADRQGAAWCSTGSMSAAASRRSIADETPAPLCGLHARHRRRRGEAARSASAAG